MNAIGQIQRRIAADALEQIRNERGVILCGKIDIYLSKGAHVIVGRIIRQLHSYDHDSRVGIARFHLIDHLLQIVADLIDRHAEKRVVNPKLENEDVDLVFEMQWEAAQSAARGAAARTGVDDFEVQSGSAQFLHEQRRVSFAALQAKSV